MVLRQVASGVIVGLLSVTLLPIGAANAAERRFDDPTGDTMGRSDIRWVQVSNSRTKNFLKVRVRLNRVVYGVEFATFVDTNRANPGPEWKMSGYADSEWGLARVRNWRDDGEERVCRGSARYSKGTDRPIAVWKSSRRCLGLHGKARVAVRLQDQGRGTDWAPAMKTFLPGVKAT